MMPFFNRIGLESVGVVGQDLDCCWAGLQALALLSSLQKEQERRRAGRGIARGRSDAQVSFFLKEKIDCLEGECVAYVCVPFTYSRCFTGWMVIRILSHWMRYFLDIGFDYGYRKCSSIWNYFSSLLVGSRLMSCNIVNYLTFLTGKI